MKECRHLLKLRDLVWYKDAFILQEGEDASVFHASVLGHQVLYCVEHRRPCRDLAVCVINAGDGVSTEKVTFDIVKSQKHGIL